MAASPGGAPAGRLKGGVLVPFWAVESGWARITTPCALTRWIPAGAVSPATRPQVLLDPGHGGDEQGAVGPTGLLEKEVNLAVAAGAARMLSIRGIPAAVTRSGDYRATLGFRVALAKAAGPKVLVSIHHNTDPDGPVSRPGTETYYQFRSSSSKRLAGLIYEDVVRGLSPLGAAWVADTDAGAKWRLNGRGQDYYGLLRAARESGVVSVLAELAFISNPSEEALLRRQEVRNLEAGAVAQGIARYLRSSDPGSGFTTPYPRSAPAGPGGGTLGCVDPS